MLTTILIRSLVNRHRTVSFGLLLHRLPQKILNVALLRLRFFDSADSARSKIHSPYVGLLKTGLIEQLVVTLLVTITLSSCGNEKLAQVYAVDDLRVLALQADPYQVQEGQTVSFEALIGDPNGSGRTLSYLWEICQETYLDSSRTRCLSTLSSYTSTTTSLQPSWTYTPSQSYQDPLYVTLSVTAGSTTRRSIKRVYAVSSSVAQISAPTVTSLSINGDATTGSFTATESQSYTLNLSISGLRESSYFVTWLTEAGSMEYSRTSTFTNHHITPLGSHSYKIYGIVNDGLGGVAFLSRQIIVP